MRKEKITNLLKVLHFYYFLCINYLQKTTYYKRETRKEKKGKRYVA